MEYRLHHLQSLEVSCCCSIQSSILSPCPNGIHLAYAICPCKTPALTLTLTLLPCLVVVGHGGHTQWWWSRVFFLLFEGSSQPVGAVMSVELTHDGMYLLASSRHGPVRLWDVRMERPLLRYKGHQNTSSSFLRATLGGDEELVLGGSDDKKLYIWDRRS
ncbi:unnamed protein product, partial [Discosporangium mesarthrocarpum]